MLKKLEDQQTLTLQAEYDKKKLENEQNYKEAQESAKSAYLELLEDCKTEFVAQSDNQSLYINKLNKELDSLKSKMLSAIEAKKRQEQIEKNGEFYKLQLSSVDIEEIKKLEEVAVWLRDPDPLNKVIWKVYYENPFTDLVGRLMTSGVHTGIYKITNSKDGKCYIGQSVNLVERLRNHIKAGLGIGGSNNKFYSVLRSKRPENFTYEILEECNSIDLNEREKY